MTRKIRVLFSGLFLAILFGTMLTTATPASAQLFRKPICAETAYLRRGDGTVLWWMYRGQTMDIYRYTGSNGWDYAYGFAYGSANQWGYIIRSAFWGC